MKRWLNFFRKSRDEVAGRPRFAAEPVDGLNLAIRRGDIEGARSALGKGAPTDVCTLDNEGYHTPLELAEKWGRTEILQLLKATSRKRRQSVPELPDET